jgi:transcriptional regulator with XRE-family HTH domain
MLIDREKIRLIRNKKRKSQKVCANAIGVTQPSYYRKENKDEEWIPDQLEKLADFLGCKIEEFYKDSLARPRESSNPLDNFYLREILEKYSNEIKNLQERVVELEKKSITGNHRIINGGK